MKLCAARPIRFFVELDCASVCVCSRAAENILIRNKWQPNSIENIFLIFRKTQFNDPISLAARRVIFRRNGKCEIIEIHKNEWRNKTVEQWNYKTKVNTIFRFFFCLSVTILMFLRFIINFVLLRCRRRRNFFFPEKWFSSFVVFLFVWFLIMFFFLFFRWIVSRFQSRSFILFLLALVFYNINVHSSFDLLFRVCRWIKTENTREFRVRIVSSWWQKHADGLMIHVLPIAFCVSVLFVFSVFCCCRRHRCRCIRSGCCWRRRWLIFIISNSMSLADNLPCNWLLLVRYFSSVGISTAQRHWRVFFPLLLLLWLRPLSLLGQSTRKETTDDVQFQFRLI